MNMYHTPFANVNVSVHYMCTIISLRHDLTPMESSPLRERERNDDAPLQAGWFNPQAPPPFEDK